MPRQYQALFCKWINVMVTLSSDCDPACVGCMGSGPARCRKCASGYSLTGSKCLGKYLEHNIWKNDFVLQMRLHNEALLVSLRYRWMQWQGTCLSWSGWDLYQHRRLFPLWLCWGIHPQRWCLCEEAAASWVSSQSHAPHLTAASHVYLSVQAFRTKVCLRISRTTRWRCCSRCSSGWCFVLWPH